MANRAIVIPLIILVVAALLFLVIEGRRTSWLGDRAKQETDDAYVQADMTPLSTRISGTVRKMKVNDFDSVKAGEVLVEIDDDELWVAKTSTATKNETVLGREGLNTILASTQREDFGGQTYILRMGGESIRTRRLDGAGRRLAPEQGPDLKL